MRKIILSFFIIAFVIVFASSIRMGKGEFVSVASANADLSTDSKELPNLDPGGENWGELKIYGGAFDTDCKNKLADAISVVPSYLLDSLESVELSNDPSMHGLASVHEIKINCSLEQTGFTYTFLHELGHAHYFDIKEDRVTRVKTVAKLHNGNPFEKTAPIYNRQGSPNFITRYALTNADEDFAESFAMYFTNRALFAGKAEKSAILKAKYEFIDSLF